MSKLEDLPDELIIEICLYLNVFDTIYSFGRLNRRFQCAIAEFRRELDLSSFSLNEFEKLYSPYLFEFVCEHLIKLTLSNEYCPGQIQLFDQLINNNDSYENKLPLLNKLVLHEFNNDNQNILSKILYIKELEINFHSYENLTKQTEKCLILNLFIKKNNLTKLSLCTNSGLEIQSNIGINSNLKDLTIQLKTLDDLFNLLSIIPNVTNLEFDIHHLNPFIRIPDERLSNNLKEIYIHTKDVQIIPFERLLKPLLLNLTSIEYISFGMKTNDPDYANGFLWLDLINSLPNLKTIDIGLEIDITENLINYFQIETIDELKQSVYETFLLNLPSNPVIIYANDRTLYIDSIPYRFTRPQSYNSSPEAARAIVTNEIVYKQSPRNIVGLALTGLHYPLDINDYLYVISRFPSIKWLYLDSININQNNSYINIKLKYLKTLLYIRSTLCKINIDLFEKLFYNHEKLDNLKITYGDLIYLLRKISPLINANHIKNLTLFCSGADGSIRLKHLYYLFEKFSSIENLYINLTSKNLFKKDQELIINQLIKSFPKLRSFQIITKRGEFKFIHSFKNNQFKCLSNLNALGSHVILQPKYFAIWISDSQTTFF